MTLRKMLAVRRSQASSSLTAANYMPCAFSKPESAAAGEHLE